MSRTKKVALELIILLMVGCCAAVLLYYWNTVSFSQRFPTPSPISLTTQKPTTGPLKPKVSNPGSAGKRVIPFQSVVLITAMVRQNGVLIDGWTGSGTFISSDGQILTNAHVVLSDKSYTVEALTISPTFNADEKPVPAYYAKVIQADEGLDLAILRITQDINGNPIDTNSLNFPAVTLGDSDSLNLGDKLTILGYPGIGGDTITLTSGEVAGFTAESPYGNRAYIKTSATIAGGNSGGLASNDAGELVGIPTQLGSGKETGIVDCRTLADTNRDGVIDENDTCVPTGGFINSLRPAKLAIPLIEAAKRGEERIVANAAQPRSAVPNSGGQLYFNDFSNAISGWTSVSDTDGSVGVSNGMYVIQVTTPKMVLSGTSGYKAGDIVVDVSASVLQSTGSGDYGMICRYQSDGSYYALEVSEDGYASIWKNNAGQINTLVDWEYFDGLEGTSEKNLTAACVGNQLGLGLDGNLLISTTDSDFSTGDTGLIAGTWDQGGLTVGFDNFKIRSPQ
jgi:S1-C subfamily serine protease